MVGLLFAALISATMSSADSDMLAAGSIFANDIYRVYIHPDASDARVLRVTRWTMAGVGALSLGVALLDWQDMITVLMFSFALRAGGEFIPYIAGHYWRKATGISSLASIVVGCGVVIYVKLNHPGLVPGGGRHRGRRRQCRGLRNTHPSVSQQGGALRRGVSRLGARPNLVKSGSQEKTLLMQFFSCFR